MAREKRVIEMILEMFEQRNYSNIVKEDKKIIAIKPDTKKICAFTNIIPKLNIAEIQAHIIAIEKLQIKHCLLVFEGNPTPVVNDTISKLQVKNIEIELFNADELQYNPTIHILVPKHRLLNTEEDKDIRKRYGTQLPEILSSDPIAKFYNFKKGSIIEILRNTIVSYRKVV